MKWSYYSFRSLEITVLTYQQCQYSVFFEGQDKNVDKIEALRAEIMEVLKHEPFMGERIPVR